MSYLLLVHIVLSVFLFPMTANINRNFHNNGRQDNDEESLLGPILIGMLV
jgi:hypothetical protein